MSASKNVIHLNLDEARKDIADRLMQEYFEICEIRDKELRQVRFVRWDNKARMQQGRFIQPSRV